MGTPTRGILGGWSGKVGTVVGSTWRGKEVMRAKPVFSKNRKLSPAQEAQHAKFAMAGHFLRNFGSLIETSFQPVAGKTGKNEATAIVLNEAISGVYPNFMIDYGLVLVSKGSLKKPVNPDAISHLAGKIKFTWTNDSGSGNAKPSDKAILVSYDEQYGDVIYSAIVGTRADEEAVLDVSYFSGKPVHTWLAFKSGNGRLCSDSSYTGVVSVL